MQAVHKREGAAAQCLITGPIGVGKSYLACALAYQACRQGYRVRYYYLPKLFRELALAHADGPLTRCCASWPAWTCRSWTTGR